MFRKFLIRWVYYVPLYIYRIFPSIILLACALFMQCNLLQQRAEEKKSTTRFNKRLVFTEKVPDTCDPELQIEFTRQGEDTIAEAISPGCVILLKWHDSFSEVRLTDWILLGKQNSYHWQGNSSLVQSDVGWGYRFSGALKIMGHNYPYIVYISKPTRREYSNY